MDPRGPGEHFIAALAARSFNDLAAVLAANVQFRILVPPGLRYCVGPAKTVDYFRGWFGREQVDRLQDCNGEPYPDLRTTFLSVAEGGVGEPVEHRIPLRYRLDLVNKRGRCSCQQNGFYTLDATGKIDRLDLVCSGILPHAA